MKVSSFIKIAGGILIAAAGLYIFLKDVKLIEIWNQIKETDWWVIAGVAALSPISLWIRAIRWKILLPARAGSDKKGLFSIVTIAFMVNNILPARIGEAARAFLLWRRNKFTVTESIGSLIIERLIDSLAFLSFLFLPIFFNKGLQNLLVYGLLCLVVFVFAISNIVLYRLFPVFTKKKLQQVMKIVPMKFRPKVEKLGRELLSNLNWAFSMRKVVSVVILSYLTMFCYVGMIWLLGLNIQSFGFLESMFGVAFAALGSAIPLSPGYVGTLHAMLLQGLTLLGVTIERAGAIAVLYHAIGYVIVTLMGIYYFFAINVSMKDLRQAKQEMQE